MFTYTGTNLCTVLILMFLKNPCKCYIKDTVQFQK